MHLILGSQSTARQKILRDMGYTFETMSANIDEKLIRFDDPEILTLALAHAKATALLAHIHTPSILITSDQVVVCNGKILEKPTNREEAAEFLRAYSEYPAETVTAIAVTNTDTGTRQNGIDRAIIYFRPFSEADIEHLVSSDSIFKHAGGFAIEDPEIAPFIKKIDGTIDSIMGLPKKLVAEYLNTLQ